MNLRTAAPVVLSSADLPDAAQWMVHGCEDCACAVEGSGRTGLVLPLLPTALNPDATWVANADVLEIPIDDAHWALFHPLGGGGLVVTDAAGRALLTLLRVPRTLAELPALTGLAPAALSATWERLAWCDLIRPVDAPPLPTPLPSTSGQLTVWLHITNHCNVDCPYCYLNKTAEPMSEATGRAAVEAVIRSAQRHGFTTVKLKYAGGEASLNYPLLLTLHDYAAELTAQAGLRLEAVILSNGVTLPPHLIDDLKRRAIRVMISLDGLGAHHDAQRPLLNGAPSFRRVERTIGRLIAAGHPPHLSITLTARNLEGLAEVVQFALDRDLTFSLNFFRDNTCVHEGAQLQYQEQAMIAALRTAFERIEASLPRWSVLGAVLDRGQLVAPRSHPCGVGQDYVVIDQHGQVAKCHMEIEHTLGDVFRHDPLLLIRDSASGLLNPPVEEKAGCKDCHWRHWCSGGCPAATFHATGRFDIKSPNCNIYKAIYPEALRLEGLRLLKYAARPVPV